MIKLLFHGASSLLLLCTIVAAIPPTPPSSKGCEVIRCGYGANCVVVDGKAKCECPTICFKIFQPVCGSDGKTYGNSCEMNVAACKQKKEIIKKHDGKCDTSSTGPPIIPLPTRISPGIGLPKMSTTTKTPCFRDLPHFHPHPKPSEVILPEDEANEVYYEDEE